MSSAPLRGRVLRWVPGRIPLALHAPGKAVEGLARTPRLSEAGFSDAQAIAGAIAEYAHRLQAISKWRRIIFEGSNFPDKNTAPKNGITRVRRNEWLAWRNTVILRQSLYFGDFTADNGTFPFKGKRGGGRPIPHFRYALRDEWILIRGGPANDVDDGSI